MDSSNLAWKIGMYARGLAKISTLVPTYDLKHFDSNGDGTKKNSGVVQYEIGKDHEFLRDFFSTNNQLILRVDAPFDSSAISPASSSAKGVAIGPHNGVWAPSTRLCISARSTGYLSDALIAGHFCIRSWRSNAGGIDQDIDEQLAGLKQYFTIMYDDRAPHEDALSCYDVNHARGAVSG
ncbi:MAG: hypothetical protein LQ337_007653 [Flavoplaca oasis]|nr:MAG: hypothetical protein LQ337_007653 [Flavoplaca oasis]